MRTQVFRLRNASGLHARPATVFVRTAAGLSSDVRVQNLDRPGTRANGKSILEVLTLGASEGQRIEVTVDGQDEADDLEQLAAAIDSGLGEGAPQDGKSAAR
ncbi:MAG TPA: HPr family phosphocarrier protein [Candidatus Dormibacteraeota bacterium]|nr:HPr family phosphocarrier protein [Candidatus Dormibacteraeota bacterium]